MIRRQEEFYELKALHRELGEAAFDAWTASLPDAEFSRLSSLLSDPAFRLQTHQIMPADVRRIWFLRMGRGSGKTFAASCAVHQLARDLFPGGHGILLGATYKDVRDTMVEGDSGLLATAPPDFRPTFNRLENSLTWPNKSKAIIRTADNPEDIRGPTLNWGWADELVKWRDSRSWDNLNRCVRNQHPRGTRIICTTTPKRAKAWIRAIEDNPHCIVSTASSMDNRHMDATYLEGVAAEAAVGSALAREEVLGKWVEGDAELWTRELLEDCRKSVNASLEEQAASMDRRYISIDPSSGKKDETGILLMGRKNGKAYVLADWSARMNINVWTDVVVAKAERFLKPGDQILLETNNNMAAENVLVQKKRKLAPMIVPVWQDKSKWHRAEYAFSQFQASKVELWDVFPELERQLCDWEPEQKDSPDRGDALTTAIRHIFNPKSGCLTVPIFGLGASI